MLQILHVFFLKLSKLSSGGISLNWSTQLQPAVQQLTFFGQLCICYILIQYAATTSPIQI